MLTRATTFHARHHYHKPGWSEAERAARFGSAGDVGGHGHLYRVEVSVTGPLDHTSQTIIDLAVFDRIMLEQVVAPLDGTLLNESVPVFAAGDELPTCEALARWIRNQIASVLPDGVRTHRVRVAEDETLWADCLG